MKQVTLTFVITANAVSVHRLVIYGNGRGCLAHLAGRIKQ